MDSRTETIMKFSDALKIDTIGDVKYHKKVFGPHRCACGQPIKDGYLFINRQNHRECVIGKNCLSHIAWYLGWK